MLGIEAASYFVPDTFVTVAEAGEHYGLSASEVKVFERIYGLKRIPIAQNFTMQSLIERSLQKLINETVIKNEQVKLIIHAHTSKNISPNGVSLLHSIKKRYNFHSALCFGVSINNCASTLSALDIAQVYLLTAKVGSKAIILTGEKTFTPLQKVIPNVSILGDASAAMLVSSSANVNRLISLYILTNGQSSNGIWLTDQESKQFAEEYTSTFVRAIQIALAKAKLKLSDIKLILPHNVNLPSWKKIATSLSFPLEKIYLQNIKNYAHCFGADILINYVDAVDKKLITKNDYFIMATVGLGSMYAVAIFQH